MNSLTSHDNHIIYQTVYQQQVYLNSGLADIYLNGTKKSNVVFFFNELLKIDKKSIEMRLSIVNAQLPYSWYLINDTNNTFSVTISGTTTNYTFVKGNYNVGTFVTAFNALLSGITLSYNSTTNLFTFSGTTNFTLTDSTNSIFPILGLVKGNTYISTSNSLTAPFPYNFSGITRVNLKSSSFNIRNIDTFNKGRSRTLTTIPVNANQGGIIQYVNFTNFKTIFKNKDMTSIQIELCDDFKNYIDFQNVDWTICLQVDTVNEIVESIDTLEDIYESQKQELI